MERPIWKFLDFYVLKKAVAAIAVLAMCFGLAGCSKSPFPVAKVSGTIKSESGKILSNGIITFTPMARNAEGLSGKPAYGEIENGNFVMSTYGDADGAIIGKHQVTLTETWRPDEEYVEEGTQLPPRHGCEISPDFEQVEVVPGENKFQLIAVIRKRKNDDEDDD